MLWFPGLIQVAAEGVSTIMKCPVCFPTTIWTGWQVCAGLFMRVMCLTTGLIGLFTSRNDSEMWGFQLRNSCHFSSFFVFWFLFCFSRISKILWWCFKQCVLWQISRKYKVMIMCCKQSLCLFTFMWKTMKCQTGWKPRQCTSPHTVQHIQDKDSGVLIPTDEEGLKMRLSLWMYYRQQTGVSYTQVCLHLYTLILSECDVWGGIAKKLNWVWSLIYLNQLKLKNNHL